MRYLAIVAMTGTLALLSSSAFAQSFTYDVIWQPVESIGGMTGPNGPMGQGGVVEGKYTSSLSDGTTVTGAVKCVGMDQPDGEIFAIHLACTATDTNGAKSSLIYGCNFIGKPGPDTPLGCVGAIQGKEGQMAGRNGSLTMEWYSDTNSRGTGQWYGN